MAAQAGAGSGSRPPTGATPTRTGGPGSAAGSSQGTTRAPGTKRSGAKGGFPWGVLAVGMLTFLVGGGVGLYLLTRGDPSRKGYDQRTPEGVLRTARLMVEGGHAERLGELMYAETPEWRELYMRLGELLGDVQDMADTVQASMPGEVEQVKQDALSAAREGRASNYLEQLFTGRRAVPRARPGAPMTPGLAAPARGNGPDPRRILNDTLKQISADPYGWLEEAEGRLDFEWVDDFTVALTWDGDAIAPPIGITMKQADDGLWYLVLPTSLPQVRPVVPDTPEEFAIWANLIEVFRHAVQDMRQSVASRDVRSLDDLSMKAGENLLLPLGLVFISYGKMIEEDQRAQREAARGERRARESAPQEPAPAGGGSSPEGTNGDAGGAGQSEGGPGPAGDGAGQSGGTPPG